MLASGPKYDHTVIHTFFLSKKKVLSQGKNNVQTVFLQARVLMGTMHILS